MLQSSERRFMIYLFTNLWLLNSNYSLDIFFNKEYIRYRLLLYLYITFDKKNTKKFVVYQFWIPIIALNISTLH
jgi:hypothetical protein